MSSESDTFTKRPGTTNKGTEYEQLNLANVILGAFENGIDFSLSTNNAAAGSFDDICLETKDPTNGVTCVQLKHLEKESKPLHPEHLAGPKPNSDFDLSKYFDSYTKMQMQVDRLILLTNRKFHSKKQSPVLTMTEFQAKMVKVDKNSEKKDLVCTSNSQDCYGLQLVEESVQDKDKSRIDKYKNFCSKFFLYTNQANCKQLKKQVHEKFEKLFGSSVEFDSFLNWIGDWWKLDGKKVYKLDLDCVQKYLQILLFSLSLNVISFASTNLNQQQKLFKEIISEFEISVFNKTSFAELQTLWAGTRLEDEKKLMHQLILKYQLCKSGYDITQLDDKTKNILLWLLDKCPLIVEFNSQLVNILQYLSKRNLIILLDENENFSTNVPHARNLFDIKSKNLNAYTKLVDELSFFVPHGELLLTNFVSENVNALNYFTNDVVLGMCSSTPSIGGMTENISFYFNRNITANIIDVQQLSRKQFQNNLRVFVIDSVTDISVLEKHFLSKKIIKFDLTSQVTKSSELIIVYSDKIINSEDFDKFLKINSKFQKVDKFRMKGNHFEWMWSKGSVQELKDIIVTEFQPESKFWDCEPEHKLNLVVDDSGMGKTEFLRNLCNHSLKGLWPVFIQPKDIDELLKNSKSDKVNLETFLLEFKYQNLSKLEKEILLICLKLKRVLYFWDGLDEISSDNFRKISDFIVKLSNDQNYQWVSSRSHLKVQLETKFNVLARHFKEFDITEQDQYIKLRLENFENIDDVIRNIRSHFWFTEHRNILGIPLLLYMITEVLLSNSEYSQKFHSTFTLAQLYKYFIDEKFKIFRQKLKMESINNEAIFDFVQKELIENHQLKSLIVILPPDIVQNIITIKTDKEDKKRLIISAGLITEITDESPRFIHKSFAEYFVARYFFENRNNQFHVKTLKRFIFAPENINVRFFFDLLMADGSYPHIAVLYQKVDLLEAYKDDISGCKDKGGRSPLHLLSSWGQPHPKFEVKEKEDCYEIQHIGRFDCKPDGDDYMKLAEILLATCDSNLQDDLFGMTPLEYSRECHCLVFKMKLILKNTTEIETLDINNLINMLYYASRYGYHDAIAIFREKFRSKTRDICKIVNCTNLRQWNLLFLSSFYNNSKMGEFLVMHGADVNSVDFNGITPLSAAAENGHLTVVEMLLDRGAQIDFANYWDETPLNVAAQNGHLTVVEMLLDHRAQIDFANNAGVTALLIAAKNGHLTVVEMLLNRGAQIDLADNEGRTPLFIAAQYGHLTVVEMLLDRGAQIDLAAKEGVTPLYAAAHNGHLTVVEKLLDRGAQIDLADNEGRTPLYIAGENRHLTVVEMLLDRGAQIDLAAKEGFTPLYAAAQNGHLTVVEMLLDRGAQIDLADNWGSTPLFIAAANGHLTVVEMLLDRGAQIDLADNWGSTPLFIAAANGHLTVVEMLLDRGAQIDLADNEGRTPLFIAAQYGHLTVVEMLLDRGAQIDLADNEGRTPLYIAGENRHLTVVEMLLDRGAQIDLADNEGRTPLYIAGENRHLTVVEMLLDRGAQIDLAAKKGYTLLHVAAQNGHLTAEKILDCGDQIDFADKTGTTPLLIASEYGHLTVVEMLLDRGAQIDLADNWGSTPLLNAIQNGHLTVVEMFLDRGAQIDLADKEGFTPLHVVAENGHLTVVEMLLDRGAQIDLADNEGRTPLFIAAQNGHLTVVEMFLDRGAQIDLADNEGRTPLFIAAQNGRLTVVEKLLDRGAQIDLAENKGSTPLLIAAQNGRLTVVEKLLDRGAQIDLAENKGSTPLLIAAQNGRLTVVEKLLDHGAQIDLADKEGFTPLYAAAHNGHLTVVEMLLDRGAQIDLAENKGSTPLLIAALKGHLTVVEMLLDHGAQIDLANNWGSTPLLIAAQNGHLTVVEMLLDRGAQIDLADKEGFTPLHVVAENGHLTVVEMLLDRGAQIDLADKEGFTPLYAAAHNGHLTVVEMLLDRGAQIDLAENKGSTPLLIAALKGHLTVVEKLLDHGAQIDLANNWGSTPLLIAAANGHLTVVEMLLDRGAQIDFANNEGVTALLIAAQNCHLTVVEMLLDRGAQIDFANNEGVTALLIAAQNGHLTVVKMLLDRGAQIDLAAKEGFTPLFIAAFNGHLTVVEMLLDRGAQIDLAAKEGFTPLYVGAQNGHLTVVEMLLDRGAQINLANKEGFTPLHIANQNDHSIVVKLLLDRGAHNNFANNRRNAVCMPLQLDCTSMVMKRLWNNE